MITRDIRGLAPSPGKMNDIIILEADLPVRVSFSFTIDKIIVQPYPFTRFLQQNGSLQDFRYRMNHRGKEKEDHHLKICKTQDR
jgi:hypothetical protein